ncbi:MAG: amino acid permease [Clostridia bacterium]|nr:amino acid permease [Clostridia bacterium]
MSHSSTIKKGFDRKHLVVMALGNIIGSGIFLASGTIISLAGPAAILGYALGAFIMFLEVMFIAEMSIVNPAPGSFRVHASEVFGRGVGFVNGWMFWCSGLLGMAGEVTAAAIFTRFWFPGIPLWVFCLIYSVAMTAINFNDVRGLSKIEMWLAFAKVAALVIFVLFGILAVLRVLPISTGINYTPFSSLGAFMPNGMNGLLQAMILMLFSYTGTGIIGLAVADTNEPEKDLPPAIYIICLSITVLYLLSIFFIIVMRPWNTVSGATSPFVDILQGVGIPFAGTLLNIIALSASVSGLNSAMYSASRMLDSLSRGKQAPALFQFKNKNGVPIYALGVSSIVLMLTAVLSYFMSESIFIILIGASGFLAMFNWLTISVTHLFYRKKVLRECPEKLKYKVWGYPSVTLLAIVLILGILATSPLYPGQVASFVTGISIIILLIICYISLKLLRVVR